MSGSQMPPGGMSPAPGGMPPAPGGMPPAPGGMSPVPGGMSPAPGGGVSPGLRQAIAPAVGGQQGGAAQVNALFQRTVQGAQQLIQILKTAPKVDQAKLAQAESAFQQGMQALAEAVKGGGTPGAGAPPV